MTLKCVRFLISLDLDECSSQTVLPTLKLVLDVLENLDILALDIHDHDIHRG
jgi:hypothetical protein